MERRYNFYVGTRTKDVAKLPGRSNLICILVSFREPQLISESPLTGSISHKTAISPKESAVLVKGSSDG